MAPGPVRHEVTVTIQLGFICFACVVLGMVIGLTLARGIKKTKVEKQVTANR